MPRCLLVLFFTLAISAGSAAAYKTCPEPFVATQINLPENSHLSSHQQAAIRAHLTGRCFGVNKPGELARWFVCELQTLGYMSPQVSEPTITVLDPRRRPQPVSVTVQFVEGPRYKIRDIRWHGSNAVSIEQIVAISELQPGDVLDMSKGSETLNAVLLLYRSIGYPDVAIAPQPQMANDGVKEVTLHFYVSEGAYSL